MDLSSLDDYDINLLKKMEKFSHLSERYISRNCFWWARTILIVTISAMIILLLYNASIVFKGPSYIYETVPYVSENYGPQLWQNLFLLVVAFFVLEVTFTASLAKQFYIERLIIRKVETTVYQSIVCDRAKNTNAIDMQSTRVKMAGYTILLFLFISLVIGSRDFDFLIIQQALIPLDIAFLGRTLHHYFISCTPLPPGSVQQDVKPHEKTVRIT